MMRVLLLFIFVFTMSGCGPTESKPSATPSTAKKDETKVSAPQKGQRPSME